MRKSDGNIDMNSSALISVLRRHWMLSIVCLVLPVLGKAADSQPDPGQLIDTVAHQVLKELDARRAEMRKDPKKIRKLVDDLLLPHFDTEYSARQVLGQHWRTATPEQRSRFIEAFYQSLLQNYGEALLDFTPDRLKIFPYKEDTSDPSRATVRTEVRRDNGSRVPVNYTLHKLDTGWKAWDVTIEGISYVKSFRTDFASEIDQKGLDAVITRLESQQASGKPAAKANGAK
jgi:phospholipid transport system substrate-binding protein